MWAIARKDGYVQQCAATATIQTDTTLDVGLTSLTNLSAARPASGPNSRTVSGVVYEATPSGRQPVAGASVDWIAVYYESVANTRSDATGRYLLCGLPQGPISNLFVTKQGYRFSRLSVEPGLDTSVDIEIIRE